MRKLKVSNTEIFSVKELSYLENLEKLDLRWNSLSSIEPLINLKNLKKVILADTFLSTEEIDKLSQNIEVVIN